MLARLLALALVVECALYAGAIMLAERRWGVSPIMGMLGALLVALMLRGLIIGATLKLANVAEHGRGNAVLLPNSGLAKLFLKETLAFTALFAVLQPLAAIVSPRAGARGDTAIIFVHGIYCNHAVWWRLMRRLRRQGWSNLHALSFEPLCADIERYACQLGRTIDEVRAATGAVRVILIAHSMGGLVARAYLRQAAQRAPVAMVITIGSPHHGSTLAHWGIGENARQLQPGNSWLVQLEQDEAQVHRTEIPTVSIFSWHDNFVAPQESAQLPGATHIALREIGHLSLLFSRRVEQAVLDRLSTLKGECHATTQPTQSDRM